MPKWVQVFNAYSSFELCVWNSVNIEKREISSQNWVKREWVRHF